MAPKSCRTPKPIELGVVLLIYEMFKVGLRSIPPVSLFLVLGQIALYMDLIDVPWKKEDVCISAISILKHRDWKRLIFSSLEHGDDMHLYWNMISFILKGKKLENLYGSKNFGALLLAITLITNSIYVALGQAMSEFTGKSKYQHCCSIGFSGVIFALKVISTCEDPSIRCQVWGITMPGRYAAWVELVVIHFLVPNSSFIGHLAGILAGAIYCTTCIGMMIDTAIAGATGCPMKHGGWKPCCSFCDKPCHDDDDSYD